LSISKFRRLLEEKLKKRKKKETIAFIVKYLHCKKSVAEKIYRYMYEQYSYLEVPHDKKIIIEEYKGEKKFLIFHSLFGRRVNDALSRAFAFILARGGGRDIEIGVNDNGFFLAGEKMNIDKVLGFITPDNLEEILREAIERTELFKRRFRHCATRSLMILRTYKGRSKTVGKQQMKSHFLLSSVRKISGEFPILKETRREILEEVMDIKNAKQVLQRIKQDKIKIIKKQTKLPSPFALNLILQGHSDIIKMEDKLNFLKRMHELHLKEIAEK